MQRDIAQLVLMTEGNIIIDQTIRTRVVPLFKKAQVYIGREFDNDICLTSQDDDDLAYVSRFHCTIFYDAKQDLYYLEDGGSVNGTLINEYLLPPKNPVELRDGDEVILGTTTQGGAVLRFRRQAPTEEYSIEDTFSADTMSAFFISFSSEDKKLKHDIKSAIQQNYALKHIRLYSADDLDEAQHAQYIKLMLKQVEGVIVLLSPSAKQSIKVQKEVFFAMEQHKVIVPVLLVGDEHSAFPAWLPHTDYIDLRHDMLGGIASLVQEIYRTVFPDPPTPPKPRDTARIPIQA